MLHENLKKDGNTCTAIHGDMEHAERDRVIEVCKHVNSLISSCSTLYHLVTLQRDVIQGCRLSSAHSTLFLNEHSSFHSGVAMICEISGEFRLLLVW